jgi:NADH dehydrogenase [ubiquinone] 1 alpha subcomplex assembly factor 5
MSAPLFDHHLRALRRDRAVRIGTEYVLFDRAFDDCLERLAVIRAEFADVLLVGCPNPDWPRRLGARRVSVVDPGSLMAARADGQCADLESLPFDGESFDLVLTVGILDTANNLPLAAAALELVLKPGGLLLGAIAGGQGLPGLRRAMLAADSISGPASPHVHPRIDGPSLAQLLTSAGFAMPVVDIDRVELDYGSMDGLVHDLRAMGATNVLNARSRRPMTRAALEAARAAFLNGGARAAEQVEILHFAAWKAGQKQRQRRN